MKPQIYKESLKVICINACNSKKLIRNAVYNTNSIHTNGANERIVHLNIGNYSINNFKLINGDSLDGIPDFLIENIKMLEPSNNNYTGQIVKCRWSSGNFKENENYYVEKQIAIEKLGYNRVIRYEYKLKIRGFRNYINTYRFCEIPLIEQRNIKLKNLNGDVIKTGEQTRKFLLYSEKEKISILFQILTRAISDINKTENSSNKLNIINLMLIRGREYAIIEEDVIPFLKGKINILIKPFLNK